MSSSEKSPPQAARRRSRDPSYDQHRSPAFVRAIPRTHADSEAPSERKNRRDSIRMNAGSARPLSTIPAPPQPLRSALPVWEEIIRLRCESQSYSDWDSTVATVGGDHPFALRKKASSSQPRNGQMKQSEPSDPATQEGRKALRRGKGRSRSVGRPPRTARLSNEEFYFLELLFYEQGGLPVSKDNPHFYDDVRPYQGRFGYHSTIRRHRSVNSLLLKLQSLHRSGTLSTSSFEFLKDQIVNYEVMSPHPGISLVSIEDTSESEMESGEIREGTTDQRPSPDRSVIHESRFGRGLIAFDDTFSARHRLFGSAKYRGIIMSDDLLSSGQIGDDHPNSHSSGVSNAWTDGGPKGNRDELTILSSPSYKTKNNRKRD